MKAQDEFSVIAIESRFQFVSGARSSALHLPYGARRFLTPGRANYLFNVVIAGTSCAPAPSTVVWTSLNSGAG